MAEDRKDVWAKLKPRIEELQKQFMLDRLENPTVSSVVMLQLQALKSIKGAVLEPLRSASGVAVQPAEVRLSMRLPDWPAHFKENILACHAELSEALEWTQWKSWKRYQELLSEGDVQNAKLELVDALCFLINCWTLLGGSGAELALMHRAKCEENIDRQQKGY